MLRASGVAAAIGQNNVPLLPGAAELAKQEVQSRLAVQNRRLLASDACGPIVDLLVDPQTSGGLLAGVPASRADTCVMALGAAGYQAAIIGFVEPISDELPLVRLD
jgi:selenide,water dikinase